MERGREGGEGVGCLGGECVRALINLWHLFVQNLIQAPTDQEWSSLMERSNNVVYYTYVYGITLI